MRLILKSRNFFKTILIRNFLEIENIRIRSAIHEMRELSGNSKQKKSKLIIYEMNLKSKKNQIINFLFVIFVE